MKCHYCSSQAVVTPEKDGVIVGLCEKHLKKQSELLEEKLNSIKQQINETES